MAVPRRLVRVIVLSWYWYCQVAGLAALSLLGGWGLVQAISGDDAVVIATDVREIQKTVHLKGRYGYVYDLERKEACPGEVVTIFTTLNVSNPAVITLRKPGVLNDIKTYPGVRVDNPLPDQVTAGKWKVETTYNSRCANRVWSDPISNFEIEVLP